MSCHRNATILTCITPSIPSVSTDNDIAVMIDDETITPDNAIQFSFRDNPTFTSVQPQNTIPRYLKQSMKILCLKVNSLFVN